MRLLIIVISIWVVGCQDPNWSTKDQKEFNHDCMQAEQSVETCDCLLNCLMIEYTEYGMALQTIQSQSVPENLSTCIEQCN